MPTIVTGSRLRFISITGLSILAALCLLVACTPVSGGDDVDSTAAREPEALEEIEGTLRSETHVFEEIAPGVYFVTGTGAVNVASNAMVVVNRDDVLVVDSHITPDAAREMLASVARLTDKPVRYLVNSHFHFDHAHGNQVFPEGVQIIGHEYTREKLLGDPLSERTYLVIGSPESQQRQIDALEARVAEAGEEERARLEAQLATLRRHVEGLDEVVPTPPNVTLVRKMTLHLGDREIELHHLGRGHTGGDVVVFLPAEKIAFTGDLFYDGAPYLGDAFAPDFIDTLAALGELGAEVYVPGHGPLVHDQNKLEFNREYLRTYWDQVRGFHGRGLSVEEAVAALDLSGYEDFAAFQLAVPGVLENEVVRMYEVLESGG